MAYRQMTDGYAILVQCATCVLQTLEADISYHLQLGVIGVKAVRYPIA
jgi:hypothetical protein